MNKNKKNKMGLPRGAALARSGALALILAAGMIGMSAPSVSHAQSTSGTIMGHAPAGDTVVVEGNAGMHRHTKMKGNGRYRFRALPLGVYTVTLLDAGNEVARRYGVHLPPGGSFRVNFACKNDECAKHDKSGAG